MAHLGALGSIAILALSLVALVRARHRFELAMRLCLAAAILLFVAFESSIAAHEGWTSWKTVLPLELCDAALVLAVLTLLRPRPRPAELVYFWAGSGTVLAMLTPDLRWNFPRWEFLVFFGLHGLVLAAALLLVFGLGLRPQPGAAWRAFAITASWAAFVGLVNFALGTNFMYLRHKPLGATPLDLMGPWPAYIVTGALAAFVLFQLLSLPFRREWRAARTFAAPGRAGE